MTTNKEEPLDQRWLVLDHLLKELIKEYDIPKVAIENLQMSKAITNYYKEDPTDPQRAQEFGRINTFLNNTQKILMDLAENRGADYVNEWTQKLMDASRGKKVYEYKPLKSNFITGMPSNFDFVRFNFQQPVAEERFHEICEYENVIVEFENDKTIFVFGEKDNIKSSLQEMSSFFIEQQENA